MDEENHRQGMAEAFGIPVEELADSGSNLEVPIVSAAVVCIGVGPYQLNPREYRLLNLYRFYCKVRAYAET